MMPFYGEPWVEEGFPSEATATMDEIIRRDPAHVLHGHYGLTFIYDIASIRVFRDAHRWLVDQSRRLINEGYSATDIVRLNLIPEGLEKHSNAFLGYLSPRNHIIARVADQMTGIWQEDVSGQEPKGLDSLTSREYGLLLKSYLGLSVADVESALEKALRAGDNELVLYLAVAAEQQYPDATRIGSLKETAADSPR